MPDKRILRAILKITLDRAEQQRLTSELIKTEKQFASLVSEAEGLERALRTSQDTSITKQLKAELAQVEGEIESITSCAKEFRSSLDEIEKAAAKAERQLAQMRDTGDKLETLGEALAMTAGMVTAGLVASASKYVEVAGRADAVGRRWLASQKQLERLQVRMGRVAAQVLLPTMERASAVFEKITAFAERHPGAVGTVLNVAGSMAVVGSIAAIFGKGLKLYADTKALMVATLQSKAAQKMLVAAGLQNRAANKMTASGTLSKIPVISPTVMAAGGGLASIKALGASTMAAAGTIGGGIAGGLGLIAGGGIYQAFANSEWGQKRGLANLQQYASVIAWGLGNAFGGKQGGEWAFRKVARALGALGRKADETAHSLSRLTPLISQAAVDAYTDYRKAVVATEKRYEQERTQIVERYARQRVTIENEHSRAISQLRKSLQNDMIQLERQYRESVQTTLKSHVREERRMVHEYYREREQLVKKHNAEIQRAEQDHRHQMLQMHREYNLRQQEAIAERDVGAYMRNLRQYEVQRQNAEEEYRVGMSRRDQDFARQVAELEQRFREQRRLQSAALAEHLADLRNNYEQQKEARHQAFDEQMQELRRSYREQLQELEQAKMDDLAAIQDAHQQELAELERSLAERLVALEQNLLGEKKLRDHYYELMSRDLETWLKYNARLWRQRLYEGSKTDWRGAEDQYRHSLDWYRASGGYANERGHYVLAEAGREFVLSSPTTVALERTLGHLTQEKILRTTGGTHHTLDINISAPYTQDLVPMVRRVTEEALTELIMHLETQKFK